MAKTPGALRIGGALLACSAAAAAPTLIFGAFAIIAFPIGFGFAFAHALVFGVPAYLVMRRNRRIGYGHAVLAGFLIGFAPVTLLRFVTELQYAGVC